VKIACVQTDLEFCNPNHNAERAVEKLRELNGMGVHLAVFPEAYLTGYCVRSQDEAAKVAIPITDPSLAILQHACDELDMLAVVGFAERGVEGQLFNAAVLFEPQQRPRFYRKTHLPYLGYDRFAEVGRSLEVFETRIGRLGILICYDMRPPEATRTLALKGADLIVLPTNWPIGAETSANHICIARAAENKVFYATCNRVGEENGTTFIGQSKIIAPNGVLLQAASDKPVDLVAEIDLSEARDKRTVLIPGEYELDIFGSRRPELYSEITEPNRQ